MVVALMCPCFNVTIYLEHAPTKQEGMLWLSEYYEISKGIGKATLAVAGVTMELPQLTHAKILNKEWITWKCLSCLNCETFIYTCRNNDASQVYVNNYLIPRIKKDDQILQQTGNQSYSPVWKIVLNDEDNCSNNVLETPEDSAKLDTFKLLESQMTQFLKQEEEKMKQRIKEYEELQHEGFKELQTRVYRDRKVLWHTIVKKVSHDKKKEDHSQNLPISISRSTETSPLTTPSNTPVIESVNTALVTSGSLLNAVTLLENNSISLKLSKENNSNNNNNNNNSNKNNNNNSEGEKKEVTEKVAKVEIIENAPENNSENNVVNKQNNIRSSNEQPGKWVNIKRKKDNTDNFMFKFEENEDDDSDASDDDLPISGFDDEEDEKSDKSDEEITPSRWESQKPPRIINMAASVPVAIPQAFVNFQRKPTNDIEPSKPRSNASKKPSEADLSKSFAVPTSRTKITNWI